MKLLVFGGGGQVGHELQRTLKPLGEVVALDQQDADLTNLENLRTVLYAQSPGVIVNAAAYTAVDKAESEPALAQTINADAVRVMADYARYNGSLLVHYSTDYVFDGEKQGAYLENDLANPLSVYGKTKRAGEEAVQDAGCHYFIFRTSWVYSAHGANFIKTILRLAKERDDLNIVSDQIGAPTSAELIADITALAILAWQADILPEGVYHLTASGETSWHGLASYVLDRAIAKGMKLNLDSSKIRPIPTEDYPLPAKRPKNSLLDNGKLTGHLGFQMPDWKIHTERVIDQLLHQEMK
ncbi:MAG: dTDP-4-dehydrorhamnose reductase [Oxalobacter sp.]|nr:MAG: dTDP-4-dehydrorhamnose reductase [Oxalobacter sp.]